jgi:solute carrier family 25 (mitochondrial dicarboxylate transporter), member 10
MAACFTHPLDQTKYRMQVLSTRISIVQAIRQFTVRDGFFSLWSGLSASILRQSTYSTTRFALYDYFIRKWSVSTKDERGKVVLCAGLAGGIAGLIGNPAEIVLVRMCADGARPPSQRFNYPNALVALWRVGYEDGLSAYMRGLGPNVVRSVLMNISQIATYTEAKRKLLETRQLGLRDDARTHVLASIVAGTVATTLCAPADVLKSRFQNASQDPGSRRISVTRYVASTIQKEGAGFLMKGWVPAWFRLAPNTVLTFVFMEKLKALFDDKPITGVARVDGAEVYSLPKDTHTTGSISP